MTLAKVGRLLLALAAALLVAWAFVDVIARGVRGTDPRHRPVTLTILHWGDPAETAIVQKLVERYEAEHPNVRVQRLHTTNYDAKLKTMFAAGTPPDLFYLRYQVVPEMASMGLLMDLEPHVAKQRQQGTGAWLDDFYPLLIDAFRYDGKRTGAGPTYGLPKDCTTYVMYVNLDLFERAGIPVPYGGWTWDQYEDAVARIAKLSTPNRAIIGGVINTWQEVLRAHIWTFGGEVFGDGGFDDVRLGDPRGVAALDLIRRTRFDAGSVLNDVGIGKDGTQEFFTGNVGVIGPLGRWITPQFRSIANNPNAAERFHWDVVPLPHAKDAKQVTGVAVVAWAASSSTKHPAEAFDLMRFLCGPDGQRDMAELGLAVPTLKSVAESPGLLTGNDLPPRNGKLFIDTLGEGILGQSPPIREWEQILEDEARNCIRFNRLTPAQAAANFASRWNAVLASPLKAEGYARVPWGRVGLIGGGAVVLGAALLRWNARRERLGSLDRAGQRSGWLFVSPWVIGFLALTLGPMVVSALLSFTRWTAMTPLDHAEFVGTANYRQLFTKDDWFGQSLWVTGWYALLVVPIGQVAALGVALLMNARVRGITLFRTAYFVPSVVSGVALSTLWWMMFHKDYGPINAVLRPVTGVLGTTPPDWFGFDEGRWAVPAFVLMSLWGVGSGMVIYLAGLKGVPASLYEAARIDGAGPARRFCHVTLPMLSPLIFFNVVMGIIASFQVFTQAHVITDGRPTDATRFYVLNLFMQAFDFHNMGYASAMAWVLFVLVLALTLLVFRGSRGLVYYEGLKQ